MKLDCCWVNMNDVRRRPRSTSHACLFTFDLFGVIFFVLFIDDNIISSIYLLQPTCLLPLLANVSKTLSLHRHFAGDVGLEDIRDFVLTILAVEHPVCWFKSDTQRMVTVCLSVCVHKRTRVRSLSSGIKVCLCLPTFQLIVAPSVGVPVLIFSPDFFLLHLNIDKAYTSILCLYTHSHTHGTVYFAIGKLEGVCRCPIDWQPSSFKRHSKNQLMHKEKPFYHFIRSDWMFYFGKRLSENNCWLEAFSSVSGFLNTHTHR